MPEAAKNTIEHWIAKPTDEDREIIDVTPINESGYSDAQKSRIRDLDAYLPEANAMYRMRSELSVNGQFVFQKASGVWTATMADIMRNLRLKLHKQGDNSFLEDADMDAVIPHGNDNEEPWRITNWKVESKEKVIAGKHENVFVDTLKWETMVGDDPFSVDTVAAWRGYRNQDTE